MDFGAKMAKKSIELTKGVRVKRAQSKRAERDQKGKKEEGNGN